jgi:hypothetical protein
MDFPCVQCGNCCRSIGRILPEYDRGNGTCRYLEGNLCAVYDRRPDICNLKTVSNIVRDPDFVEHTLAACVLLCRRFGDRENLERLEKLLKTQKKTINFQKKS